MRLIDRTGHIFDKLTVVSRADNTERGHTRWNCICTCGTKLVRAGGDLTRKGSKSCADCANAAKTVHGLTDSRVHNIWMRMLQRTTNKNCDDYTRYGYGLVGVDPAWLNFEQFYADMGEPTSALHSIDRIDNSLPYTKTNCRWATATEQARNKTSNKLIEFRGETLCLAEWCEKLKLNYHQTWYKLYTRNLSVESVFIAS